MARRPLGFGPRVAPQPQGDWDAYNAVSQAGQARVLGAMEDRYRAVSGLMAQRPGRAPVTAQIGFNPRTGKYVVGTEEFDADDPAVVKMFAELDDLPQMQLAPGLEARSLADVKARWQDLYNNAEVDNRLGSIGRGMLEAVASVPRGVGAVFGADIPKLYEGADAWRRENLTMYERVGRTMAPNESLVGFGQAGIQAIETGVPVLAAGAIGSLASPVAGAAAAVTVAGGMASASQGDEAAQRLQQALSQAAPEDLAGNAEYMSLRRAGNNHTDAVSELVRRGRTSAARTGAVIGGATGLIAAPVGRFAMRGLGFGGAGAKAGDEIGDAMLRALRGSSTGMTARLRGSAGMGAVGGTGEGAQEFFETDISQAMADISAGTGRGYEFGRYGTWADFFGGVAGGGPLGALGGLRTPPTLSRTGDPSLDAALDGVVAPPGTAAPAGPAAPRQISAAEALAFDRKNLRPTPPARGQTQDMFGAAPSFGPGVDAEAAAMTELEELYRVIPQMQQRMQATTDPQEQAWMGMQLESLQMRREQLESQFGSPPAPSAFEDPNQTSLFDADGSPTPQQSRIPGTALRPLGTSWTSGQQGGMGAEEDIIDGEAVEVTGRRLPPPRTGRLLEAFRPELRDRLSAQEDQFAQRFEDSYNNPALLPDQFSGMAEEQAQLAQERDQLERMLDERRAAGFAENDPVADGIRQRLAIIEQSIGPRGTQGELAFPNGGQGTRPAGGMRAADESIEGIDGVMGVDERAEAEGVNERLNAAAATRPMFGPSGGPTPAARVPKNETLRESDRKITAEIAEMLDPNAGRDAVWISGRAEPPAGVTLPKNVRQVRTRAGILLTTNKSKARRLQENPARGENQAEVAKLLNFPINKEDVAKSDKPPVVVKGRNKASGTPTVEMLVPEDRVDEGVDAVSDIVNTETTAVEVTTPEEALAERRTLTSQEATKKYNQRQLAAVEAPRATPPAAAPAVQQAGEVKVELAGTPEQQRKTLMEMLAPLERRLNSKVPLRKSDRERIQAQADQLLAQLDALEASDAEPTTTETGGRGPSKGSVPEGSTETGRDRAGPAKKGARRSPTEEARRVDREAAELARQIRELESEPYTDFGVTDESRLPEAPESPPAQPPTPVAEGLDAPVLAAAEMSVEVDGGESQVKPSVILDWYRKRLENLTRLMACVLK